jgi:hypothetical protein
MTAAQRENAALYFHGRFLGLELPENSAQLVRKFFEKTRDFIKSSGIPEDKKVDLYNSLYTYLKVDKSPTVQVARFADSYFPDDIVDRYRTHMQHEGFPERAIQKDLSEVSGSLRLRKFRFPNKITLSGPPEAINEFVSVEAIEATDTTRTWTRITVRGPIEGQE